MGFFSKERISINDLASASAGLAKELFDTLDLCLDDLSKGKSSQVKTECRWELCYFSTAVLYIMILASEELKPFNQKIADKYKDICADIFSADTLLPLSIKAYAIAWPKPAWLLSILIFLTTEREYLEKYTPNSIDKDTILRAYVEDQSTLASYYNTPVNLFLATCFTETATKVLTLFDAIRTKYTIA